MSRIPRLQFSVGKVDDGTARGKFQVFAYFRGSDRPSRPIGELYSRQYDAASMARTYGDRMDGRKFERHGAKTDAPVPTNPDNAGDRMAAGSLIAELAGEDYVTTTESAAVLEWCREWVADCYGEDTALYPAAEVLRRCNRLIDGGLAFVLADVRRVASTDGLDTRYAETPRDTAQRAANVRKSLKSDATLSGDDTAGEDSHNRAADYDPNEPYDATVQAIKRGRETAKLARPSEDSEQVAALRAGVAALTLQANALADKIEYWHAGKTDAKTTAARARVMVYSVHADTLEGMADKLAAILDAPPRGGSGEDEQTAKTASERIRAAREDASAADRMRALDAARSCSHVAVYGRHNWAGYHEPRCLACGKRHEDATNPDARTVVTDYADATYTGRGEFYSGMRTGDRVTVRRETVSYTWQGERKTAVSLYVQSQREPGGWLSVYHTAEELENVSEFRELAKPSKVARHSAVLAAVGATHLDLMNDPTAGMPGIIAGQITAALCALVDGKTTRARAMLRNAAHNLDRLDS